MRTATTWTRSSSWRPEPSCLRAGGHRAVQTSATTCSPTLTSSPRRPTSTRAIRDKQRAFIQRALTPGKDAELEERLGEINVATLVVFGTEDTFIPTEMARVYKAKIPNCSYAMVYDAGHMIEAERPAACAELLDDFMERKEVFVVARNSTVINP